MVYFIGFLFFLFRELTWAFPFLKFPFKLIFALIPERIWNKLKMMDLMAQSMYGY